ncbi:hypothetical protein [Halocatena marina]|uniref:hypothetical protein n=1 Tax=Halocatena marina TaxID=2934937 RepID=UPI00200BDE5B|nr:hypothetical protein [Halocatena marina]
MSVRDTFCTGDVIATLIGTAVLGLGVLLWISPEMGLFSNDIAGIRRLAELTMSLGINATVLRGLLIYSLIKETPEREDHSLAANGSPQSSESLSDFRSFRLCAFVIP